MSKSVLFYFTGTGNSLAVVRKIADRLTDTIVVPMLKGDSNTYIDSDTERIGLIYPIYMNAVPHVVAKFINNIKIIPGCYVFAIANNGGNPGMAGLHLDKVLNEQNINLDAYFELEMVNNTPKGVAPKPLMNLDWELDITSEKVDTKLKTAYELIDEIAKSVLNKEKKTLNYPTSNVKKVNYLLMKLLWYISEKSSPKLKFLFDESCTGCGLCEAVCTANRIKMSYGKPECITENCNFCYACFNYCPVQAIGVKHYTKKLGRYHNPEISADDIAKQK
jgi:formate hydrogenlyase subunit 6/NADH:ubiquinone oxidoreductase subunit I